MEEDLAGVCTAPPQARTRFIADVTISSAMTADYVDRTSLRPPLRALTRGQLLLIAERAIERLPPADVREVLQDFFGPDVLTAAREPERSLLEQVDLFTTASLRGNYYESFQVNSRNCTERSRGTDAFVAEFDRLIGNCTRAAPSESHTVRCLAFERLFDLLRRLDEGSDDVLFFGDEGGSYEIGVDWRTVLPAYFRCLATTSTPEQSTVAALRVITDFVAHEREHYESEFHRCLGGTENTAL